MSYIAGSIVYTGLPVPGVTVRAHRTDDGSLTEEVNTDSDGFFLFVTLTLGDFYTVVAHHPVTGNAIVWDPVEAIASLDRSPSMDGFDSAELGEHEVVN